MASSTARGSTAIALAAAAALAVLPRPCSPQEPVSFGGATPAFEPNTIVARYAIDPDALARVTDTSELIDVLRESLRVEAAMPLDEPLQIALYVRVGSPEAANTYDILYGDLAFLLAANSAVATGLTSALKASYDADVFSDWDEEAAWTRLLDALDTGLSDPASPMGWADALRERGPDGHVPLRIAAVRGVGEDEVWEVIEGLERDFLVFEPRASFGSSAMAGWEAPEGLAYETRVLLLELDPAPETDRPEPPAVELSTETLDRYVGRYEIQPGAFLEIRREEGLLVAGVVGNAPEQEEIELRASSETEFRAEVNGDRITFAFTIGADGSTESVTMSQSGFSQTLPRVP